MPKQANIHFSTSTHKNVIIFFFSVEHKPIKHKNVSLNVIQRPHISKQKTFFYYTLPLHTSSVHSLKLNYIGLMSNLLYALWNTVAIVIKCQCHFYNLSNQLIHIKITWIKGKMFRIDYYFCKIHYFNKVKPKQSPIKSGILIITLQETWTRLLVIIRTINVFQTFHWLILLNY